MLQVVVDDDVRQEHGSVCCEATLCRKANESIIFVIPSSFEHLERPKSDQRDLAYSLGSVYWEEMFFLESEERKLQSSGETGVKECNVRSPVFDEGVCGDRDSIFSRSFRPS